VQFIQNGSKIYDNLNPRGIEIDDWWRKLAEANPGRTIEDLMDNVRTKPLNEWLGG